MSSFKKGMVALLAFVMVSLAPVASVASDFASFKKIQIISVAHADESPTPSVSPAPAVGDKIGAVGDQIGGLADKIPNDGIVITMLAMVVGFLYDFARRKWPTKNPASFWIDVSKIIKGVVAVLNGLVKLLEKMSSVGDKVMGQNVKA